VNYSEPLVNEADKKSEFASVELQDVESASKSLQLVGEQVVADPPLSYTVKKSVIENDTVSLLPPAPSVLVSADELYAGFDGL